MPTLEIDPAALESEDLKGKWVAFDRDGTVVAHSKSLKYVMAAAARKGVAHPTVVKAPLHPPGRAFF